MALVAYSDESDIEMEEEEEPDIPSSHPVAQKETVESVPDIDISDDEYEDKSMVFSTASHPQLFAYLPVPTKNEADTLEEEEIVLPVPAAKELEDRRVLEEERKTLKQTKGKGKKIIMLPSLNKFSDLDALQIKEKPVVIGKTGSSLLSLLPQPKQFSGKEMNRPLIPHSLMKPKTVIDVKKGPSKAVQVRPIAQSTSAASAISDEEEESGPSNFFSFAEKEVVASASDRLEDIFVPRSTQKRALSPRYEEPAEEVYSEVYTEAVNFAPTNLENQLENEALMRLHGKRSRMTEPIQFLEVSEDAIRADPKDWLKQISLEKASVPAGFSASKKDGPDAVSRRKHQITHLVHQAKSREIELKNQWAQNRQTKRQTQSKYGF